MVFTSSPALTDHDLWKRALHPENRGLGICRGLAPARPSGGEIVTTAEIADLFAQACIRLGLTTAAVTQLAHHQLPFITLLTDPTMGGVSASFAFVGDVVIAEPGALIGFAGPRVIEQTVREKLPEGFQRAEFLLDKGALDMIVDRRRLREELPRLLALLTRAGVPVV